jgi:hypothetical protein
VSLPLTKDEADGTDDTDDTDNTDDTDCTEDADEEATNDISMRPSDGRISPSLHRLHAS